jgi:hypothetical protein
MKTPSQNLSCRLAQKAPEGFLYPPLRSLGVQIFVFYAAACLHSKLVFQLLLSFRKYI